MGCLDDRDAQAAGSEDGDEQLPTLRNYGIAQTKTDIEDPEVLEGVRKETGSSEVRKRPKVDTKSVPAKISW